MTGVLIKCGTCTVSSKLSRRTVQGGCQEVVWRKVGRGQCVSEAWDSGRMALACLTCPSYLLARGLTYINVASAQLSGVQRIACDTVDPQCSGRRSPVTSSLHITLTSVSVLDNCLHLQRTRGSSGFCPCAPLTVRELLSPVLQGDFSF